MRLRLATISLLWLLASSCTTAGYYRREARRIDQMRDADYVNGILRADPNYYLNRWLGLPVRRALVPPRKRDRLK